MIIIGGRSADSTWRDPAGGADWKCESPTKMDGESAFPVYAAVIW